MTRKKWLTVILGIAILSISIGIYVVRAILNVEETLHQEKQKVSQSQIVPFATSTFTLAPSVDARLYAGPARFRGICEFQQKIYAATAAGLQVFSPDGSQLEQWTSADGLPSLDLTTVLVHEGSLWIGTSDAGLLRFDGEAWRHLLPEGKFRRSITQLHSTPQGMLFVGTANGLLVYEETHFRPLFPDPFKDLTITALEGDAGRLWIGTFQNGLYLLAGGTLTHYGRDEGMTDLLITDIESHDNTTFVSTASGIHAIQDDRVRILEPNRFVTSLAWTKHGLWLTTQDGQIRPLQNTRARIQPPGVSNASRGSRNIRLDQIGEATVALEEDGVRLFKDHRLEPWIHQESPLTASNVSALLRTRNGNLWIGYFDEGIDVLSGDLQLSRHMKDETLFCINHLSEDSGSRIYVSTANGLAVFHPDGSVQAIREKDGLLSDRVQQALPLDQEGRRVAIATAQGFTLKEDHALKSMFVFHGLVNNHVYAMASDSDQLYLGTLGGMNRIEKMMVTGTWTEADSGLNRNWINALAAVNNTLYVGTYGSGVQAFTRSGEWIPMEELPEDLEINPNAFYFDGRFLFCGTLDRGFYFMDVKTGKWKHYLSALPGRNVTSFTTDHGFLYVGTTRGLIRIRYEALYRLPDLS